MDVSLNAHEARVLGVLIEKAFTTPDQYPLSLNAVTNGSNQKSNRHPQTDFSEAEVNIALTGLQYKHLSGSTTPAGSRVEKYRHNAQAVLGLGDRPTAVLAELLLRGPQTKGEIRTRASRMCAIESLDELGQVLAKLQEKGYVARLDPAPGSRAERYGQLLAKGLHPDEGATPSAGPAADRPSGSSPAAAVPRAAPDLTARVAALEGEVQRLRTQLEGLAGKLGEPLED